MNNAYAHEAVYPHTHPHPETSTAADIGLALLFGALVALLGALIVRKNFPSQRSDRR
jgi:hypothetical protein